MATLQIIIATIFALQSLFIMGYGLTVISSLQLKKGYILGALVLILFALVAVCDCYIFTILLGVQK